MKIKLGIYENRPLIKCPKCNAQFCIDAIGKESKYEEGDGKGDYYTFMHLTSYDAYCFYCGTKLTIENTDKEGR